MGGGRRRRRIAWILLAGLVAAYAGASTWAAWRMVHPPRGSDPRRHEDPLGPRTVAREVTVPAVAPGAPDLAAWHVTGPEGGADAVLLLHGYKESRSSLRGLARAIRERVATALLLPDFRAFGATSGDRSTLGILEREDARAALAWMSERGHPAARTVVVGYSMGAVAGLRAVAAHDGEPYAGLVLLSPYDRLERALDGRTRRRVRLPARPVFLPTMWLAERFAGSAIFDVDVAAEATGAPVARALVVGEEHDWRAPPDGLRRIAAALGTDVHLFPGEDHALLRGEHRDDVRALVAAFVARALGG